MSKRKTYRRFSPEDKVSIIRQHLLDQVAVSELCEAHDIKPSQYYQWQRQFFEKGGNAFTGDRSKQAHTSQKKIARLENQLAQKDEVIAEVAEAFVTLKKQIGES